MLATVARLAAVLPALTLALALALALAWVVPGASAIDNPPPPPGALRLVSDAELLDELKSAPADNPARMERLRELYLKAGARPEDVVLQPVKLPGEEEATLSNVIVTKKGTTDDVIVVGGHLDKVTPGTGVIDDWSGACMAQNLYQALKDVETTHTFVFIGFAHEEKGLVGSRAYVASLDDKRKKRVKAMVNLECLGPDETHLWTNGSTDALEALARKVAADSGLPLKDHELRGVGADSIPFERAGIANITFDGLPREKFRFIHSEEDTFENIDPNCYLRSYRLVARFLLALDAQPAGLSVEAAEPKP